MVLGNVREPNVSGVMGEAFLKFTMILVREKSDVRSVLRSRALVIY